MIGVIMLSNTANEEFYSMTNNALDSIIKSEDNHIFEIILVETNIHLYKEQFVHQTPYENKCRILIPNEIFNYNKFLNIAFENLPVCDYYFIANNDIICHKGFASVLINALETYDSVSPKCPSWEFHKQYQGIIPGYKCSYQLCGWAIMFKRNLVLRIPFDKLFPSCFKFWFQDNYYAYMIMKNGFKHALVCDSLVTHLGSKSHNLIENNKEFTIDQKYIYDQKIRSCL